MKVLLKEEIKNLGIVGSIVDVSDGYARNYLIPRNLAIEANVKNLRKFEHEKNVILEKAKKVKKLAEDLASKLSNITLSIEANAGEEDKLFGSITTMDIADALSKQGVEVNKRRIILDEPIKRVGRYNVQIKIHPKLTASVNLEVKKIEQ